MNALILAAGKGTRLGELTRESPKALVKIGDYPMLEYQLQRLKRFGFSNVVINSHHFGDKIFDYLAHRVKCGMDIKISEERERLLNTGGGIKKAIKMFSNQDPILVHNVDVFSNIDLAAFHKTHCQNSNDVSLLVACRDSSRNLFFDKNFSLIGWRNSNTGQIKSIFKEFDHTLYKPVTFQGIHIISRRVESFLDSVEESSFNIIDFYLSFADKLNIKSVKAPLDMEWVDAGKPYALEKAQRIIQTFY